MDGWLRGQVAAWKQAAWKGGKIAAMPFLLRRLLHSILLLLAVSLATFVLADLAPGSALDALRLDPSISAETLETLRQRNEIALGSEDDALTVRYVRWLHGMARGDLGLSVTHRVPVADLLTPRLGATLLLGTTSTALAWLLALGLGSLAAIRPAGRVDRFVSALQAVVLALPEILLALLALLLAARVAWLPVGGLPVDGGFVEGLRHLFLPATVIALGGMAVLVSHVRTEVARALDAPAVRAARGHGLGRGRLLLRYVLPEAANPLISLFGLSVGALLSGSLVVEAIFSWPGLGPLLLSAIQNRDLPVVVATILVSSACLVVGQLLADVWLYAHDPRIREGTVDGP